jgi:hypothetical protein
MLAEAGMQQSGDGSPRPRQMGYQFVMQFFYSPRRAGKMTHEVPIAAHRDQFDLAISACLLQAGTLLFLKLQSH